MDLFVYIFYPCFLSAYLIHISFRSEGLATLSGQKRGGHTRSLFCLLNMFQPSNTIRENIFIKIYHCK